MKTVLCLCLCLCLLLGCRSEYADRREVCELSAEVQRLSDDLEDVKRGFRTVPVTVTITNAWER